MPIHGVLLLPQVALHVKLHLTASSLDTHLLISHPPAHNCDALTLLRAPWLHSDEASLHACASILHGISHHPWAS